MEGSGEVFEYISPALGRLNLTVLMVFISRGFTEKFTVAAGREV